MGNRIRKLRLKHEFGQAELAAKLGTTKIQLSRWERNWDEVPPIIVKELEVLFNCGAEELLGQEIPVEEWRESPYAIGDVDEVIGTLELKLTSSEHRYPLGEKAADRLEERLDRDLSVGNIRGDVRPWVETSALNNLILMINPRHIVTLSIERDTLIPHFSHPEVYRAMQSWEDGGDQFGPLLTALCEEHIAEVGEETAIGDVYHLRVIFADGTEKRVFMDEWSLGGIFNLEAHSFDIEENALLEIIDLDEEEHAWVNLSRVALIEVPEDEYHRLMAPEQERAPVANDA